LKLLKSAAALASSTAVHNFVRKMTAISPAQTQFRAVFVADWRDALFIHFRVDPAALAPRVPLPLDLFDGDAWVSLVAFTQERLRPAIGWRAGEFLSRPLACHEFLNLRTYVVHEGEPGIFFLAEWIPNPLAVFLGPRLYGLPYKLAELDYETKPGCARRRVAAGGEFCCRAQWNSAAEPAPAERASETEFLIERYRAFTLRGGALRRFCIRHTPWKQMDAQVTMLQRDLLAGIPIGTVSSAQYSPGVCDVRISGPSRLSG
jgi:uncharacterized protein YqjF (DUF2071 family)